MIRIETIFDTYTIQSASPQNTINLEVPIQALQRALQSAVNATTAQLRLTKKDNVPMLSLTIVNSIVAIPPTNTPQISDEYGDFDFRANAEDLDFGGEDGGPPREREAIITQDVPVKVLPMQSVEGLHEPRTREADVNIYLPPLTQVKSISERFAKLAMAKDGSATGAAPRLELSANMHGSLKIATRTDALSISSVWTGLMNPELDPATMEGGSQAIRDHPSTRMKVLGGENGEDEAGWAKVRIDARDWSRVLSVGRLGVRVIACRPWSSFHQSVADISTRHHA